MTIGDTMNDIMVSICCLAYNHEQYIRGALDSFLMQKTNFKFEVLIHDDASTDNTPDIIREYEEKYPDIIKPIYQKENQYSKGIKVTPTYQFPRAKGKYIAMCEGDDYWTDKYKLQKQFDILQQNPDASFCVHGHLTLNMLSGTTKPYLTYQENCILDMGKFLADYFNIFPKVLFQTASFFFRAQYIKNIPEDFKEFFSVCPVGDIPLELYLGSCGKIYYLADVMSVYRSMRPGSWTVSKKNSSFAKRMLSSYKIFNQCTAFQYTEWIEKFIEMLEFQMYLQDGAFRNLVSKKYKPYFDRLPLKSRVYVCLGAHTPRVLNMDKKGSK